MMNSKRPDSAADIIFRLIAFTENSEEEIKQMSSSEVDGILSSKGIDTKKSIERIKDTIRQVIAKDELSRAKALRQERLREYDAFTSICNDARDNRDLINRLKDEFNLSNEEALVYCRKFEKSDGTDMQTLLDDLRFLNKDKKNDDVGEKTQ